jgi:hypothetical protein
MIRKTLRAQHELLRFRERGISLPVEQLQRCVDPVFHLSNARMLTKATTSVSPGSSPRSSRLLHRAHVIRRGRLRDRYRPLIAVCGAMRGSW